jgi:uncharacterized lipoprotein
MMLTRHRHWIAVPVLALAAGCGLLPNASSGCDKPQPYQSARETEPLKVPPGVDAPDTRGALRIPAVPAPKRPPEKGRCLDHPPAYGGARPQGG